MSRRLMPPPMFSAKTSSSTDIGWLKHNHFADAAELAERRKLYVDEGRPWLCGYILPPFQRPLEWSEAQMIRFVESAWKGVNLGIYVVNDIMDETMVDGRFLRGDRWLLDGQQRLTALQRYFDDAFPVFGHRWSALPRGDQLSFERTPFPSIKVHITDELEMRRLYDLMNFGGVPHRPDQRALPDETVVPALGGPALTGSLDLILSSLEAIIRSPMANLAAHRAMTTAEVAGDTNDLAAAIGLLRQAVPQRKSPTTTDDVSDLPTP